MALKRGDVVGAAMGPAWKVEGQRETTQVNGAGKLVEGVEVTVTTRDGHTGTVFISRKDYGNVDSVKAILADKAAHMDAIGSLSADTEQ